MKVIQGLAACQADVEIVNKSAKTLSRVFLTVCQTHLLRSFRAACICFASIAVARLHLLFTLVLSFVTPCTFTLHLY